MHLLMPAGIHANGSAMAAVFWKRISPETGVDPYRDYDYAVCVI